MSLNDKMHFTCSQVRWTHGQLTYCKHEGGILKVSLSHHDQIPPAAH